MYPSAPSIPSLVVGRWTHSGFCRPLNCELLALLFLLVNKNMLFPLYPLIVSLPFIVMPSCVEAQLEPRDGLLVAQRSYNPEWVQRPTTSEGMDGAEGYTS